MISRYNYCCYNNTPWQDKYKVKLSKKVIVNMNENKQAVKQFNNGVNVKVNIESKNG